jgi:predicted DsbA family dithiol-disulfide isomerase
MPSFSVTWDYLCPFARNAHEHLATALRGGADWDVRFRFFSLAQAHVDQGGTAVWDDEPLTKSGVLAGLSGLVVRERDPEHFLDAHMALFSARHDQALDLRERDVVARALDSAGLDGAGIVAEAASGWAVEQARAEHEESVQKWEVFGVPTFISVDKAVFVRLMNRPEGDAKLAESSIEKVLDLLDNFANLNEYKFTRIPR